MRDFAIRLLAWLIRFLERLRARLEKPAAGARPVENAFSRLPPEYARELLGLIRQGKSVTAGRLEVLGLERLRQHYAEHWAEAQEKINAVVRLIISRHIDAQDCFAQVKSCHFILLFAEKSLKETAARTALIGQEIYATLIDHPDIRAHLRIGIAAEKMTETDFSSFDAFLEKLKTAPLPPPAQKPASVSASVEEKLSFKAMPVWDAGRRHLIGYQCYAENEPGSDLSDENLSERDQTALGQARQIFHATQKTADLLIFCPLHFRTIQNSKMRAKLLQMCQTLPAPMRARLAFEILGIPRSLEVAQVNGVLESVRDFAAVMVAGARIDRPPSDNLCRGSVNAISLDLRGVREFQPQMQKMLDAFAGHAKKNQLRLMAHGIKCPILAEKTAAAGFNTIDGEALHPPLEQADPALSLD